MNQPAILLIDAGNTRIKWARRTTQGDLDGLGTCNTADPIHGKALWSHLDFDRVIGVCVAGDAVRQRVQAALPQNTPLQWLSGSTPLLGMRCDYATPHTLGADRWLAAYGVANAYPNAHPPLVLATFGTATTVDVVHWDPLSACSVFAGGIIIAGLASAWQSVSHSTAQLPDVSALPPANDAFASIPNSTQHALQLGAIDCVVKPTANNPDSFDQLPEKIKIAAQS